MTDISEISGAVQPILSLGIAAWALREINTLGKITASLVTAVEGLGHRIDKVEDGVKSRFDMFDRVTTTTFSKKPD